MKSMITQIKIDKLHHHPNNPRQDLGDITELAESIKAKGILQNLTVVPIRDSAIDEEYYVVIGNRRLEAAKLAGLEELPCQISRFMSLKDQQAIMLLENMQRNDLTPYEQAHGFQMCLDLGMDENELKVKTGFSKKTIRQRLKMLELDEDKLKKSMGKGANIQDYIDLEKIEDIEKRNELLEFIGTTDFRYKLNIALSNQEKIKIFNEQLPRFKENMKQVDNIPTGYRYYAFLPANQMEKFDFPKDGKEYCFSANENVKSIYVYVKCEIKEETSEEPKELTQDVINVEKIKELVGNAYQTRLEFAKDIYNTLLMDISQNREYQALFGIVSENLDVADTDTYEVFKEVTGLSLDKIDDLSFRSHKKAIRLCFALAYAKMERKDSIATVNCWYGSDYGSYKEWNKKQFRILYDFLKLYGYEISEEEEKIMFGTHELYKNTEE